MSNRLSHSSASRFQTCPKSYEYHYLKNLRQVTMNSSLLFGSAIDVAIGNLLKTGDIQSAHNTFDKEWCEQEINGVSTGLRDCLSIVYANSDYDGDLIYDKYLDLLFEITGIQHNVLDEVDRVYQEKAQVGFANLPDDRKLLLNQANWVCLKHKGHLMINAFQYNFMPNVKEVLGTQIECGLENHEGDSIIGYVDFVCKYGDYEKPIIFDLKTSTRDYDPEATLTSPQLSLYMNAIGAKYDTRYVGYVVLYKQIIKNKEKVCSKCGKDGTGQRHKTCDAVVNGERCNGEWTVKIKPVARFQTIISEVPVKTEEIVIENFDYINTSIKTGNFPRNFNSCIQPWGKCSFYELCYKGSMDGLCEVKPREKK